MPGVLNQDRFAKGLAIWRKDSIADLLDRIIDRANQRYPAQQLLPAVDQGLADEVGGKHPRQEHHKQYQHDLKTRDLQAKQRLRRQKCRHKAFQCADQQGNNPNRNDQGYPDQQARNEVSLEETHVAPEPAGQVAGALPATGVAGAAAGALLPVSLAVLDAVLVSAAGVDEPPPLRKSVTYQPEPLS